MGLIHKSLSLIYHGIDNHLYHLRSICAYTAHAPTNWNDISAKILSKILVQSISTFLHWHDFSCDFFLFACCRILFYFQRQIMNLTATNPKWNSSRSPKWNVCKNSQNLILIAYLFEGWAKKSKECIDVN